MSKIPHKITAYGEYVAANLPVYMRSGGGLYTYAQLAEMVSLKPTGNFRRRIKQMVQVGLIYERHCYTDRGNLEYRFTTEMPENGDIPF